MKRIVIDARGEYIRTALLSDGRLRELFLDAKDGGSLVGRVVLGVVKNILPSRFAFIDIGYEQNAFMNMGDRLELRTGRPVLVQVYKDASGHKGPSVGDKLHFNGVYVILFASERRSIGVSQKITDKAERRRLRRIAERLLAPGYGVIMRTNSENKTEEQISAELESLTALAERVAERARYAKPPCTLYEENSLLNDLLSSDTAEIWVNEPLYFARVRQAVAAAAPELLSRVYLYTENEALSLFDVYGIEQQAERALQRHVWLPCGGFVIFEQTEACVIIDVNTGKFTGARNYRETVLKTNLEAAACVAEQVALRNLSGMIIVDFIDMENDADKRTLLKRLTEELKKDRVKTMIAGMTELGLVQLTRKKTRPPLYHLLERECPCCGGTGRVRR